MCEAGLQGGNILSLVNPTRRGEARQGHVPPSPLVEPSQQSAWNVCGRSLAANLIAQPPQLPWAMSHPPAVSPQRL